MMEILEVIPLFILIIALFVWVMGFLIEVIGAE